MGNKRALRKLLFIACAVVVVAAGAVFWKTQYGKSYDKSYPDSGYDAATYQSYNQEQPDVAPITYDGADGKTALELLQAKAAITAQDRSYGTYVDSINGTKATESRYWALYVNGELSQQSADDYITKTGDKIEWKFE